MVSKLMIEKKIGAIVVAVRGKPAGIITERDILTRCYLEAAGEEAKVKEIMSQPLIDADADTPIGAALDIMVDKNIRRLLVTEKGKYIGIVTQKDLVRGTLDVIHSLSLI